jgi:hypothetical protein
LTPAASQPGAKFTLAVAEQIICREGAKIVLQEKLGKQLRDWFAIIGTLGVAAPAVVAEKVMSAKDVPAALLLYVLKVSYRLAEMGQGSVLDSEKISRVAATVRDDFKGILLIMVRNKVLTGDCWVVDTTYQKMMTLLQDHRLGLSEVAIR